MRKEGAWELCSMCNRRSLCKASSVEVRARDCQNLDCRAVFDSEGKLIGRWTKGYEKLEVGGKELWNGK